MNYGTALLATLDLSKTHFSFTVITGVGKHARNPYLHLRTKLLQGIEQHAPHLETQVTLKNPGRLKISTKRKMAPETGGAQKREKRARH